MKRNWLLQPVTGLDSKPATDDYQAFLNGEVRYMSLKKANPANADRMYAENEANAKAHYEYLSKLGALYNEE